MNISYSYNTFFKNINRRNWFWKVKMEGASFFYLSYSLNFNLLIILTSWIYKNCSEKKSWTCKFFSESRRRLLKTLIRTEKLNSSDLDKELEFLYLRRKKTSILPELCFQRLKSMSVYNYFHFFPHEQSLKITHSYNRFHFSAATHLLHRSSVYPSFSYADVPFLYFNNWLVFQNLMFPKTLVSLVSWVVRLSDY